MSGDSDTAHELNPDQRAAAIALAERTVERGALYGERLRLTDPVRREFPDGDCASFVSVYLEDRLNGCVGSLRASRPLPEDIVSNALHAAFDDHRFPPVEAEHLADLDLRISVLAPLEPVPARSEDELWEYVDPGRHGLLLSSENHRGTFLPSVWKQCPNPDKFLAQLKQKAGLDPDDWPPDLAVFRYTTDVFDRERLRTN